MFKASIENVSYTQRQIDEDASKAQQNQSLGIGYIQKYASIVDALANLDKDTSLEDTKLKLDKAETSLAKAKTTLNKLELQVNVLVIEQQKEKAKLLDDMDTVQRNIAKIQ
jgi:exonuclease VII small subunit